MSDRLWLGDKPEEWADVNLVDYPDMVSAILAFQLLPGPLKVFGPAEKIRELKRVWYDAFDDPNTDVWLDPDTVDFR